MTGCRLRGRWTRSQARENTVGGVPGKSPDLAAAPTELGLGGAAGPAGRRSLACTGRPAAPGVSLGRARRARLWAVQPHACVRSACATLLRARAPGPATRAPRRRPRGKEQAPVASLRPPPWGLCPGHRARSLTGPRDRTREGHPALPVTGRAPRRGCGPALAEPRERPRGPRAGRAVGSVGGGAAPRAR